MSKIVGFRKTGSAAAIPYRTPLMLTSIIASQSSTRRSSSGEIGMMPALLTRASSFPNRSDAKPTSFERSWRFVTSIWAYAASAPLSPRYVGRGNYVFQLEITQNHLGTASASSSAVASPIPMAAPVIATTLFSIPDMASCSCSFLWRAMCVSSEE